MMLRFFVYLAAVPLLLQGFQFSSSSSRRVPLPRYLMSKEQNPNNGWKQFSKALQTVSLGLGVLTGSAAIGASTSVSPAFADAVPVVGQVAPDFVLPSSLGKEISLNDLKGKRTVLYFYPADFTSGCTLEAQTFERDIAKYRSLNAQIVGVSVDSIDKHMGFTKKCGLEFPLLSDSGGIVSFKYGSLFDFGFMGKFSNRQTYILSPDLKIEYVFTDVDSHVSQHSAEVLSKLKELNKA